MAIIHSKQDEWNMDGMQFEQHGSNSCIEQCEIVYIYYISDIKTKITKKCVEMCSY